MIELNNGDYWILDASEWKDAGIPYKYATARKIPIMPVREFIEKLVASHQSEEELLLPRKWTDEFSGGYWNGNFDPYKEVFTDASIHTIITPWAKVYVMPWEHTYVIYQTADDAGYDACVGIVKFDSFAGYIDMAVG